MRLAAAALAAVLAAWALPLAVQAGPAQDLDRLLADYDRFAREQDPVSAGLEGDPGALVRWPDDSPAAEARRKAELLGFQQRLDALKDGALPAEAALNRDDLAWEVRDALDGLRFDTARIPFSADSGPFSIPDYVGRTTAVKDRADAERWLQRVAALPAWYAMEMANVRRGIATGWTLPRSVARVVAEQAWAESGEQVEQSALLLPFKTLPATIPAADQAALRARLLDLVTTKVTPAELAYADLLADDYLKASRQGIAASDLPGGRAYYAWLTRHYTTTDLSPDQVQALGQSEIVRIRARMQAAMAEARYPGTFAQFLQVLRTDRHFYVSSREALLEKASEIAKRIDYQLPHWFGVLPRLPYGVVEVPRDIEESYTTGRYFPGSPDQGVAGAYLVNTSHLDQRPLYELPALTLHEAVPGHHLQVALGQERKDIPFFRRNAEDTAFVEGWGLYAEGLGEDMGIYRDPYERFGRLSYEMWRACRLVADTGMHWLGWSREKARQCFEDNTALSDKNIEVELDRYVSWPGQALAYKVGELKLLELRTRARKALGERFDIRAFHDQLLHDGPLPLALVERRTDAWIESQRRRAP